MFPPFILLGMWLSCFGSNKARFVAVAMVSWLYGLTFPHRMYLGALLVAALNLLFGLSLGLVFRWLFRVGQTRLNRSNC